MTYCRWENEKLKDESSLPAIYYRRINLFIYEAPARYLRNLKSNRRMWTPTMIDEARLRALSIYMVYLYVTSETSREPLRENREYRWREKRAKYIRDAIDQSGASEIVARDPTPGRVSPFRYLTHRIARIKCRIRSRPHFLYQYSICYLIIFIRRNKILYCPFRKTGGQLTSIDRRRVIKTRDCLKRKERQ